MTKPKKKLKASQEQPKRGGPPIVSSPLIEVRNSAVHGRGVFAAANIRKGTRILEYLGDRISHEAADARYEDHDENDNHTFLFIVDKHTVIDAAVGGNDARFINHQCSGNCESVIKNRRVFIDATRDIAAGDELGYDYEIGRDKDDPPNVDEIYACRCGSPKCRGTMLWPAKKKAKGRKVAKRRKESKARKSRRPQAKRRGERSRRRA
jgi:SET domain-containing protein